MTAIPLPPAERDFEIYEAVHVVGCSTYSQAKKHDISQTRVRQVICRVVEWLGQVLPPQAKVAREQEIHLARQIAADRFQYQLEQATELWNETKETKYASLRIRLTMAQARLGAVGGRLGGLAADAIEGIPVPVWREEPLPESDAPPKSSTAARKPRRTPDAKFPLELYSPICYDEISPELVALAIAHGCPLPSDLIEYAKLHSPLWPREADPTPPNEDCSAANDDSAEVEKLPAGEPTATPAAAAVYGPTPAPAMETSTSPSSTTQPLLTAGDPLPVTSVELTPDHPGAVLSQATRPPAERRFPVTSH